MGRDFATWARSRTALLLVLNLAVAAGCAVRLWHGSAAHRLLATAPQRLAAPHALPAAVRDPVDLDSIQSAALFHGSRSFYIPAVIPEVLSRPDYRLSATWTLPKQPAIALLLQNQSGAALKVRPGEHVEGWTVESIDTRAVLLRHGEQQMEIRTQRPVVGMGMARVPLPPVAVGTARPRIKLLGQPTAPFDARVPSPAALPLRVSPYGEAPPPG